MCEGCLGQISSSRCNLCSHLYSRVPHSRLSIAHTSYLRSWITVDCRRDIARKNRHVDSHRHRG
eukprot:5931873-Heterocapsa_arctica.AAC.1